MKDLRKFIITTIREYLNENVNRFGVKEITLNDKFLTSYYLDFALDFEEDLDGKLIKVRFKKDEEN
jgi:hypothetical protein